MRHYVFLAAAALLSLFLWGCASKEGVEGKPLPDFNFQYIEKIPVQVGAVEALNRYGGNKLRDDLGDQYAVSPDQTLQRFLDSRFQPQAMRGRLVLEIQEASVFRFEEDSKNRVAQWLDVAGYEEYLLTLSVNVRAIDIPGYKELSKVLTAQRKIKFSEHASVAEREYHQFEALEKAIKDMDTALQRVVKEEMGL